MVSVGHISLFPVVGETVLVARMKTGFGMGSLADSRIGQLGVVEKNCGLGYFKVRFADECSIRFAASQLDWGKRLERPGAANGL